MTARVLVVDDIPANVELLRALLAAAHFRVDCAYDGRQCLAMMERNIPDIVLLDVMMPGMNGFDVCRQIKSRHATKHIPVVMVTALGQPHDRVTGLRSGADDFLTKPVDPVALIARVRNLVRLKMMHDEMHLRQKTLKEMGLDTDEAPSFQSDTVLLVDGRPGSQEAIQAMLPACALVSARCAEDALSRLRLGDVGLVLLDLTPKRSDLAGLCSTLRAIRLPDRVPILGYGDPAQRDVLIAALEAGVSDFIATPLDPAELIARVRTQFRRKRLADRVALNVRMSLNALTTDPETGLNNRVFFVRHLGNRLAAARSAGEPLVVLSAKIDGYRSTAADHGHAAGLHLIRVIADQVSSDIRGSDFAARTDVDEISIVMPHTSLSLAAPIAERLRDTVGAMPIALPDGCQIGTTLSIGLATLDDGCKDARTLFSRAERSAAHASTAGCNRVAMIAA